MIKAENIHKQFGTLKVLKGVDLEVAPSEIVSIVGPSGAGKSTLLHILGTIEKTDGGRVLIKDTPVDSLKSKELATFRNRHIGFIFQFHHLLPEFNATENVAIPAYISGDSRRSANKKANELLDYMGLKNRLHHKPAELSGGEQQRVAVARALINQPSIVLADEPSGNLDTKTAEELHKLFFKLRDDLKQTFVIVTHNQKLAEMAERKLTIKDGTIENRETPVVPASQKTENPGKNL